MTTPCTRVSNLLAETPEAGKALATLEAGLAAHADGCARCQAELAAAQRLVAGLAGLHADYEPPSNLVAVAMRRAADGDAPKRTASAPSRAGAMSPARGSLGYLVTGLLGAAAATAAVLALQPGDGKGDAREPRDKGNGAPASSLAERGATRALPARVNTNADLRDGLAVSACLGDGGETSCDVGREITTPIGESRSFKLSDGTVLQLDQDSLVRLSGDARALTVVRGNAFLDVAHREDLDKLVVTLPTGAVEVIGTELEVRAGESLSVVDVVEGVVAVAGDDEGKGEAKVRAGQTALLRAGKKPVVKASAGVAVPGRDWVNKAAAGEAAEDGVNLGFGSIRARRPGASADADKPLRLVDHLVSVRMQGAFARTTIEESFASDESHELEGIYRFSLPPGAQVAELSLMVDGRWEEGGFVERDRAEKIWAGVIRQATPIVKRREIVEYIWVPGPWRDPALLSQKLGNTFELRIFPIPARGERRVRIAYTESLPLVSGGRRYVLPLPSAGSHASAERFDLDMKIGTTVAPSDVRVRNYELERTQRDGQIMLASSLRAFRPKGDLTVEVPDLAAADDLVAVGWGKAGSVGNEGGAAHDGYVAFTLRPELAAVDAERTPVDVVVIADTSYGMQKVRLGRAGEVLERFVAGLDPEDRVQVLACAATCRSFGALDAASASLGRDLGARLAATEPLGATRLEAAFEAAHRALDGTSPERRRIVYLGDGVQTVGELDPARIVEAIRADLGDVRVTAVALGGETDHALLGALAREHAGSFVDYARLGSVEATAALALARQHGEPLRDAELVLPSGLVEMAPARFGDLWPGEERIVTARATNVEAVAGDVVLRGMVGGEAVERRWSIEGALADDPGNAFVPRLWAERRIADLSVADDLGTKGEIVKLSQAHHVLSRHTSLLVLESPAMAKAFDVKATREVGAWDGDTAATTTRGGLEAATGAIAVPEEESEAAPASEPDPDASVSSLAARAALGKTKAGHEDALDDPYVVAGGDVEKAAKKDLDNNNEVVGDKGRRWVPGPAAQPMRPSSNGFAADEWGGGGGGGGGAWVPMKKVWYKEASIGGHSERADAAAERELSVRERSLDAEPESRERTMALVRWHLRMDDTAAAKKLADKWLSKDRMDPDALVALADIASLEGDLERAEGLLSSAVEADPQRAASHLRMARLYEAEGKDALACEHRLSRALVSRSDLAAQVEAVRCGTRASRIVVGLEEGLRGKVERALEREPKSSRVSGPWRLDASWDVGQDLDLVVVTPQGRIVTWQGGADMTVEDATSTSGEKLTFKGSENGRWQVFVVRKDGEAPERVEGTLRVTAHGQTRRLAFVVDADERLVPIADIDVVARFRWEPAN